MPTATPYIIVVTAPPGPGASVAPASPTPATPTSAPTFAPTSTLAPSIAGATAAPTEVKLATYSGSTAQFSVLYPADWTAADHEQSQKLVVITAPDQLSSLLLLNGAAGTLNTEEVLQTFLSNFAVPALKTSNQRKNADGSLNVDLKYNDSTGSPLVGLLRLVRQSTSANFYVLIFSATPDRFAQTKELGTSLLNSFQERTSIARQSTPPVIAGTTSTFTPVASDTPVPTATPPPPTITPRPVFTSFRVDAQARGYEAWGRPKQDGCNSFATGQWDNLHPVNRVTVDVILTNNGSQTIAPENLNVSMFSSAGASLLVCPQAVASAPPRGFAKYVLTTFVEPNQFLSELRLQAFGATLRTCFARANPPGVIGCG